jgi:hypothetical protein
LRTGKRKRGATSRQVIEKKVMEQRSAKIIDGTEAIDKKGWSMGH